jgi:serine/threonine protein kinase
MKNTLPVHTKLQADHFVIDEVLSQGGFGITYGATDTRLNRAVAIKEFFPHGCVRQGLLVHPSGSEPVASFDKAKAKFIEEARALAQFHHPNIVQVHTFFLENNTAYMVMEYLRGRTLGQLVNEQGKIEEANAVAYITTVGQALAEVHKANLVHRDVKPDNIMVCENGRTVLIDFGLTKQEVANMYGTRPLTGSSATGTDGYAPIEQYSRSSLATPSTDIYALGATLYFVLTGRVPPAVTERVAGTLVPPIQHFNSEVGRATTDAVMWAMEMQATHRPQTSTAFLAKLTANQSPSASAKVNVPSPIHQANHSSASPSKPAQKSTQTRRKTRTPSVPSSSSVTINIRWSKRWLVLGALLVGATGAVLVTRDRFSTYQNEGDSQPVSKLSHEELLRKYQDLDHYYRRQHEQLSQQLPPVRPGLEKQYPYLKTRRIQVQDTQAQYLRRIRENNKKIQELLKSRR